MARRRSPCCPAPPSSTKVLKDCALPLTGERCVHRIITDLGVLDITDAGLALIETAPGVTVEELVSHTGAPIHFDNTRIAC
ncbi:acyl CoA:acetate/3-ketoacid CoA transferase beta subunit [Streptomyces sp. DSM 42143]|nr:acyl CoA:acetate/3-ketoacid CoA transferase beta subunit [Streptomyces sp. DSM 42143]